MAIGLSNVETRKAKKPAAKKAIGEALPAKSRMATTLIENSAKVMGTLSVAEPAPVMVPSEPVRQIRERREKASSSGELNSLWLDWSTRVAGIESESVALMIARQWMELERFVFDLVTENLVRELRKTAFGVKVVSRVDRYRK